MRLAAEKIDGGVSGLGGRGRILPRQLPHVVGALNEQKFDVGARGFQRRGQRGGLGRRNKAVGGAVRQEERRGVRSPRR